MSEEASSSGVNTSSEVKTNVEEDEREVTMVDVLEEEEDLEDDANAVLGGSDDQNCTYSKGYVTRQALYTCQTCVSESAENTVCAGICLACSYNCHEGHELVELYTKRNFKCDCGNSKFGGKKCSLEPEKDSENEGNQYNQNFRGLYCTCARPYPDPEDTVDDEMIQCVACEDWFHGRHLDMLVQAPMKSNNFSEMICGVCMEKHSFLWNYNEEFGVNIEVGDVSVDVEDTGSAVKTESHNEQSEPSSSAESKDEAKGESSTIEPSTSTDVKAEEATMETKIEKVAEKAAVPANDIPKTDKIDCYLKSKPESSPKKMASFWTSGWRKQLCTCQECKELYAVHKLSFLLDEGDMVQTYEEAGKQKGSNGTQYEQGMRALSSMDRISQVEALQEYNEMKLELKEFLAQFAATKRVVREEDIKEFFKDLKSRKRRRVEPVPYFCH